MAARIVRDSQNRSHRVLHQEMRMSCGPACVAMAEEAYGQKCIENGEERIRTISLKYPGHFTTAGGTTIQNLAEVMRAEGIPTYEPARVERKKLFSYFWTYVTPRTPVIAQLLWLQPSSITMQTHFVLLKQIDRDHRMIFLDPLHDVVEMPRAQLSENYCYRTAAGANGELTGWVCIPHLNP